MKQIRKSLSTALTIAIIALIAIFSVSALSVGTVSSLKATPTNTAVTLSWKKATNASGYRVYEYVSGSWKALKTTTATSFKAENLKTGTKHTYAVKAYGKEKGKTVWAKKFVTIKAATRPALVKTIKATQTENCVSLTWNKVSGATGYRVYKYNTSTKKWETALKATSKTTATVKNLTAGKKYYFAVKPYINTGDSIVWASTYTKILTCTKPSVPSKVTAKATTKTAALSWSKVTGATGYRVYRYNSSTKKWVALATTTSRAYTVKGLTPEKSYIFAVKPYIKVDGNTVWGSYKKVSVKTNPIPLTADKEHLTKVLAELAYMSPNGYNKNDEIAKKRAFSYITNPIFGLYTYYDEYYGWNSNFETHEPCPEGEFKNGWGWLPGDPLKRFEYSYAYAYFPADKVDWLLKNVFGFSSMKDLNEDSQYYYNGYYYIFSGDGGDATLKARIDTLTEQSDGSYIVKYSTGPKYNNGYTSQYTAKVSFKKVSGKTVWTINGFNK